MTDTDTQRDEPDVDVGGVREGGRFDGVEVLSIEHDFLRFYRLVRLRAQIFAREAAVRRCGSGSCGPRTGAAGTG